MKTAYDDAIQGRWCDSCHSRAKLVYPDGSDESDWRAFNPDTDPYAFCGNCHEFIGSYTRRAS